MKIAIIGAGWAGMAAALKLRRYDITVFEAAKTAGGRARPIAHKQLGLTIDNGQHILIGAYHATFGLMQSIGIDIEKVCLRQNLCLQSLDHSLTLKYLNLPSPLNRLGVVSHSNGLSGIKGRLHLLRVFNALKQKIPADINALNWLQSLNCPTELLERLWQPLCIAICNTDLQQTQAKIFARTLKDSIASRASDSDIYIPKNTLADLWQHQACKILGNKIQYTAAKSINHSNNGWLVNNQYFDKLIITTPAYITSKLISDLNGADDYLKTWPDFEYAAIGTLSLLLEQPWLNNMPMALLFDNPHTAAWGQWAFNHYYLNGSNLVNIVIGDADRYADVDKSDIVSGVIQQIRQQSNLPLPPVTRHALITEKRATFKANRGSINRPGVETPWNGLFLAGDWVDTGYPAVLEGAVRSGLQAASLAL